MSYQALARKWRPQKFADVVGQQHVLTAIANGLSMGRVHHAYLFSGTRGVGKTSIARLLAKGLNCEVGITATPCGKCDNCREIEEGRFVDLLEIDAASRTKVEDTRDILDNVQYAPARGRFKVYLIDEVHMLSRHSFNALLKTLEEPPEHVKFLLATTDPQKLPITILSRCLQFHLKALDVEQISAQLERVLLAEEIATDDKALRLIARSADGSMRDALSLTDQAIAMGNGEVSSDVVSQMLGTLDDEQPLALIEALVRADGAAVMAQITAAASRGVDWESLLVEALAVLHRVAMIQLLPGLTERQDNERRLSELARLMPPQDLQLYYQILLTGRKELAFAPDRRCGIEMTFLRALAFHPKVMPVVDAKYEGVQQGAHTADVEHAIEQKQSAILSKPVIKPTPSSISPSTLGNTDAPEPVASSNLSSSMAQLLQARNQLQQRIVPSHSTKKNDSRVGHSKTNGQPTSPLERLIDVVDDRVKNAKETVSNKAETTQESYRWKAQSPESEAPTPAVTLKSLRTALEHEKTPELMVKLAEEAAESDLWAKEITQLTIPKLVQQLALNAAKEQVSENKVRLHLRSAQRHLNTEGAREALTAAMATRAGVPIELSIVEDDAPTLRTPLECRQAIYEEKLAKAKRSIVEDPHIQVICRYFDAELDEESIRPV